MFCRTPHAVRNTLRGLALVVGLAALVMPNWTEAGGKKPKPPEPSPEPSPEAPADPAIAFTLSGTLTVMNADGSNVTTILEPDALAGSVHDISWSPDIDGDPTNGYQGSLVFERVFRQDGTRFDLWVIDVIVTEQGVVGANQRNLVPATTFNPAWSPRGDLIAFDGTVDGLGGVFVVSPAGGSPTLVVQDPAGYVGWSFVGWPAWSPDGTYLAYTCTRYVGDRWIGSLVLKQVIDPGTGGLIDGPETVVIPEEAGFKWIDELDWSRDGDWIAFEGEGETLSDAIYVVQAAESGAFMEVKQGTRNPTWSPDDPATPDVDETDQFLLYPEFVKGPPRTRLVRQELATGVETVVFDRNKEYANCPDWRRFPSVFVSSP